MIHIFLSLFRFFQKHRPIFYLVLFALLGATGWFAAQIRFGENINSLMPQTEDARYINEVFRNIKVKDKIVVLVSAADTAKGVEPDRLIVAGDSFLTCLQTAETGATHIAGVMSRIDNRFFDNMLGYTMSNLPVFLDTADYRRMDTLLQPRNMAQRMAQNYGNLMSPLSVVSKQVIFADPLGMAGNSLKHFEDLRLDMRCEIYDEHIFSADMRYMMMLVSPSVGAGEIGKNQDFVDEIEQTIAEVQTQYPDVRIAYFGGTAIGVYNARQIKADAILAMIITVLIIGLVIIFAFRRRSAVPLIVAPVLFGGLFALAVVSVWQGSISTIAVGAGSAIAGIAFSYAIHVFCHSLHSRSAEQVISELAYPMTIGSFTTIAAFAALTVMSSDVLHDFGLFSCFTLVGTTLFCLVFMPHFLRFDEQRESRLMNWIERLNAYPFDRKGWLLGAIAVLFAVCLFFCNDVKFNADMMQLNYLPKSFAETENILNTVFQDEYKTVYFVSAGSSTDETLREYEKADAKFKELKDRNLIKEYSSAHNLLIPIAEQKRRIELWNNYWTTEKKENLRKNLSAFATQQGFKPQAFERFLQMLEKNYTPIDYTQKTSLLADWIEMSPDSLTMAITRARLLETDKTAVYAAFADNGNMVILDKPYFASQLSGTINSDFNRLLFIVAFIVFGAILVSYGRFEIALLAFLPMAMSWVIILGLMALLGIEFNIINIIISTFIFGIGDDFSIFVADGLLCEYKTGRRMLQSHKTAIFFSAFTVVVGLGAMIFSKHPALHSISTVSIIGMLAVVAIACTVQPFVFRLLISGRTAAGKFPHTLFSLAATVTALLTFLAGSIFLTILSCVLFIFPIKKKAKKLLFHHAMRGFSAFLLYAMVNVRKRTQNPGGETFEKPAVVIANHQSVIDILRMMMLHPKIVMVTKDWVRRSLIFGHIVRYAGFVDIGKGYETAVAQLQRAMAEGYSVVVFPEGSRSADCRLRRFHKGAFYLAERLQADIVPVLLHGLGQVMSKDDIFYLKNGVIAAKILPRITYKEGEDYQTRCKRISKYFKEEHAAFAAEIDGECNPYFRYKLMKNYTYKDPVLEWYTRVKVAMEGNYRVFDEFVPRRAKVTDIGCGYGFLSCMLNFRSPERSVVGIDYDGEKINTAQHVFSRNDNLRFFAADASVCPFELSDVFIMNDVLHYLPKMKQDMILANCVARLNGGGKIIVRDGDRDRNRRHALTRLTEFFSIKVLKFNKAEHDLHFLSTKEMQDFADRNGLSLLVIENDRYSSNTIYVFEKFEMVEQRQDCFRATEGSSENRG